VRLAGVVHDETGEGRVSQTSTGDVGEPRGASAASRPAQGQADRKTPRAERRGERRGLFARIALFLRQVAAELRKVVRPTRNELITYTTVCIVFVAVVMAYVAGLDIAFGKLVLLVFGGRGA
jgi:preprotein translocase subunit SecE